MKKLIGAIAIIFLYSACKFNSSETKTLPIYGTRQAVTKTVNGQTVTDTVYQTIPAFKYINQYGDSISSKNTDGKIYVADFFFTSCPSICPVMQRNMLTVYNTFKANNDVKILSFSIDPKYDSVKVLKKYADKLGIEGNMWWLLQGKKDDTYKLAEKSYLVAVNQDSTVPGGYVHQGYFVLIDKQKRIRGSYDGTSPQQVAQLVEDIKTLQTEAVK
ncbi:SCO family protein [Mucilaginibacter sp.]|uniref:SCO family protein n=1 Tax=Mucilaginibacter sp. TaxID=1882438 RepID=UPI003D0CB61C